MERIGHALQYTVAHWEAIAGILALLMSVVGTLKNLFVKKPKIETALDHVADVLAWASRPETKGLIASAKGALGRFSVPGVPSRPIGGAQ